VSKNIQTWWAKDFTNEETMLVNFIAYIAKEKPDLLLAWNIGFDYNYLYNRVDYYFKKQIGNFAEKISPIGLKRVGEETNNSIMYPAGISIVDYLKLFKKVHMREASYTLDYISQKHLKEESWQETDFSVLSDIIKQKNINDINRLVKLENIFKLIPYYDEIRRLTKVQWEDLYWNSRIVEMLLFEEAKNKNIILPNKPKKEDKKITGIEGEIEDDSFEGATREALLNGVTFDIGKFDLGSAYPSMIVNYCLDTHNIIKDGGVFVEGNCYRQNPDALLPSVVKKILILKDNLKKTKKNDPSEENKIKYDAIKAIVNSCFGVMGNQYFRLFDKRIASATAFLVRDLLGFVQENLKKDNLEIIYWDTDSCFLKGNTDKSDYLNNLIQEWGKTKYGKDNIDLSFEYEGYFDSLFILGKCHYYGYIHGKKEPEIKGIEIKRSSSSKYEAWFQKELLEKIIHKETREQIESWIKTEKERIKTLSPSEVAFPCKLANRVYKTEVIMRGKTVQKSPPIFVRAYGNSQNLDKKFKLEFGELFYYIYMIPKPPKQPYDVLSFIKRNESIIDRNTINWDEMIRRNINSKTKNVFEAMGWVIEKEVKIKLPKKKISKSGAEQLSLF
jgi:DNA polymerase elongation subunit (family B)